MKKINVIEMIKKAGVRIRDFARPPFGPGLFALTIKRSKKDPKGTILLHPGTANIKVHGISKTHHQAVITVREKSRAITRYVSGHTSGIEKPKEAEIQKTLTARFPVTMPTSTVWSMSDIKVEDDTIQSVKEDAKKQGKKYHASWRVSANITATVKNSTVNHLLMGIDEMAHFICPLPSQAHSVAHAHQMLRPKGVTAKTPRQGEWFFMPPSKEELSKIHKLIQESPSSIKPERLQSGALTHVAKSSVRIGRDLFARGYITDRRQGHHYVKHLPGWRKVLKNTEGTLRVAPAQREAARRRTRSWD